MADMISVVDIHFIIMVFLGSLAGLFVGAIPGLSVSMATALLVSITYTWDTVDALAAERSWRVFSHRRFGDTAIDLMESIAAADA